MISDTGLNTDEKTKAKCILIAAIEDIMHKWQLQDESFKPEEDVCVLFSGGVDSSITLYLAHKLFGVRHAMSVIVTPSIATDEVWATATISTLNSNTDEARISISHTILKPSLQELIDEDMPFLVTTLQSFDPMALRNSVCAAKALRHMGKKGFKYVLTGDAADELLGGYNFTHKYDSEDWLEQRKTMVDKMHFDSIVIGQALGLQVTSPFLHPNFIDFSLSLSKQDCVGTFPLLPQPPSPGQASEKVEEEVVTGKLPIRKAFPELSTSFRRKDPAEIGSGTTLLGAAPWSNNRRGYFDDVMDSDMFDTEKKRVKARYDIDLRDKEHVAYFLIFEQRFLSNRTEIDEKGKCSFHLPTKGKQHENDDPCPACQFHLGHPTQTFCLTCGHYDPALAHRHEIQKEKQKYH